MNWDKYYFNWRMSKNNRAFVIGGPNITGCDTYIQFNCFEELEKLELPLNILKEAKGFQAVKELWT